VMAAQKGTSEVREGTIASLGVVERHVFQAFSSFPKIRPAGFCKADNNFQAEDFRSICFN